ncbi:oligosaccharide flippase family protein [Nocardioides rubriscoriae]|uniref:oligosaccharide flippase family protein n=1 Tax=Nocardioides rubriscoriae TaxID=642762 RepID=UPI0011E05C1F|nr:oligosaccharide flippase family protein [Nocardioides rubriscoriae]
MSASTSQASRIRSLLAYGSAPALGLISAPLLARALGPNGRGEFASVLQPMTVVTGLACMGVPTAMTYFASSGSQASGTLRRSLLLVTAPGVVTYIVMVFVAGHLSTQTGVPLAVYLVAWLLIPLGAYVQVLRGYWQAKAAWGLLDLERVLSGVFRVLAIAIPAALVVTSATWYSLGAVLAVLLASSILIRRRERDDEGEPASWASLSRYAVYAWPMSVALFVGSRLDQALMPAASSVEQLGLYAVAATVAEVPLIVTTLIGREALPLAAAGKTTWEIVADGRLYWFALLGMCLVVVVSAPWLVPLAFGSAFQPSVAAVQILLVGSIGTAAVVFQSAVLAGRARPRSSAISPLVAVLITLIGFTAMWGRVSSTDAALISAVAQIAASVAGALVLLRTNPRRIAPAKSEVGIR